MVAYKVRKGDGTWYTLGSGSGAVAKIRRGDGSWAADDGAGLLAKVRKIDGTMAAGVDFSTGTESPWYPGALEPVNHDTWDRGFTTVDLTYVGSTPFVRSDDGGYIRWDTTETFLPRHKQPVAVFSAFNIRDYAWEDAGTYNLRMGARFAFGATPQVTDQSLQVCYNIGPNDYSLAAGRLFEDAFTYAANNTHEAATLPITTVTEDPWLPGGFYYDLAADGEFCISTPMRPLWRTDPGFTTDTFVILWSMVLLPPPDGFLPLSSGD